MAIPTLNDEPLLERYQREQIEFEAMQAAKVHELAKQAGITIDTAGDVFATKIDPLPRFYSLAFAAGLEHAASLVETPHWKPVVRTVLREKALAIRSESTKILTFANK